MISDDDLDALPDDPIEAFLAFERLARAYKEDSYSETDFSAEETYTRAILEFRDAYEIPLLSEYTLLDLKTVIAPKEFYRAFQSAVDGALIRIRLQKRRHRVNGRGPVLPISPGTREVLEFHLQQMRDALREADLSDAKREAISRKINALAQEIATNRTTWEVLSSLVLEIADVADEVDKKIDPLRRAMDSILRRIKKEREDLQLPKSEDRKQLPPPDDHAPE